MMGTRRRRHAPRRRQQKSKAKQQSSGWNSRPIGSILNMLFWAVSASVNEQTWILRRMTATVAASVGTTIAAMAFVIVLENHGLVWALIAGGFTGTISFALTADQLQKRGYWR